MKVKATALFLCGIVTMGAAAGYCAPPPSNVHYELKVKSESFGNMGIRKMWIKGSNMRWESKSARLPLALVKNEKGVFLIHPWRKIVAKYPDGAARSNPKMLFPGPIGPVKTFLQEVGARKQGKQQLSNQPCDVYSFTDPASKRPVTFWVNQKSGKPVQLVMKGQRGKIDTITATYTLFELNAKAANSLFEVPKGYAIKSMPKKELASKVAGKKTAVKLPG